MTQITQKTWTALLGTPQPGTRYEVRGHELSATTDGTHYRLLWTFDSRQAALAALALWLQGPAGVRVDI